jgi:hypothetical protein
VQFPQWVGYLPSGRFWEFLQEAITSAIDKSPAFYTESAHPLTSDMIFHTLTILLVISKTLLYHSSTDEGGRSHWASPVKTETWFWYLLLNADGTRTGNAAHGSVDSADPPWQWRKDGIYQALRCLNQVDAVGCSGCSHVNWVRKVVNQPVFGYCGFRQTERQSFIRCMPGTASHCQRVACVQQFSRS